MIAHIQNHKKHDFETKNFTKSPFLLREFDADKTLFQPAKTQKMTINQDVGIPNFEVLYEEQMMAPIQNHTKHDIETLKISLIYLFSSEN
jgi:hypothetical protein